MKMILFSAWFKLDLHFRSTRPDGKAVMTEEPPNLAGFEAQIGRFGPVDEKPCLRIVRSVNLTSWDSEPCPIFRPEKVASGQPLIYGCEYGIMKAPSGWCLLGLMRNLDVHQPSCYEYFC